MSNLKLYKRGIALFTGVAISLCLSGCNKNDDEVDLANNSISVTDEETEPTIDREYCEHLLISFGDDHVTFKECDGYDIKVVLGEYSGKCSYFIENDDIRIMEGVTFDYNYYYVDHKNYESDVKSLQKK